MQSCNCDIPGSAFDKGSCFFNPNVWERIWSKEKAAGSSQLTPSFTVEEVEFPLNARDLTAFIADAKLMVASLAPGVYSVARQLAMHLEYCKARCLYYSSVLLLVWI
jgi:hypothetical protein